MWTINNTTCKPGTHKENGMFYPVVKFYSSAVSDSIYINEPKNTRSKALTVAKRAIRISAKQKGGLHY